MNRIKVGVIAAMLAIGTVAAAAPKNNTANKDIVDSAVAPGTFQTLAKALQAADLVNTLKGPGPFTVFAPTDEAFAKLPAGTLNDLLKPENKEKLRAILTYHVVAGNVPSAKVVKLTSAKTVNGQEVKITATGGNVMVNNARVVKADIPASNGRHPRNRYGAFAACSVARIRNDTN